MGGTALRQKLILRMKFMASVLRKKIHVFSARNVWIFFLVIEGASYAVTPRRKQNQDEHFRRVCAPPDGSSCGLMG